MQLLQLVCNSKRNKVHWELNASQKQQTSLSYQNRKTPMRVRSCEMTFAFKQNKENQSETNKIKRNLCLQGCLSPRLIFPMKLAASSRHQ